MQPYDTSRAGDRNYERGLPIDETQRLIASDKVEGTSVFDRDGNAIGVVHNFMVDKVTGKVAYAVMSFGGLFGIGEHYFPLPWSKLDYDTRRNGYVVDVSKDDLERAPKFTAAETPWSDPGYGRDIYDYYRVPFYM
jgi:hypothetical protein